MPSGITFPRPPTSTSSQSPDPFHGAQEPNPPCPLPCQRLRRLGPQPPLPSDTEALTSPIKTQESWLSAPSSSQTQESRGSVLPSLRTQESWLPPAPRLGAQPPLCPETRSAGPEPLPPLRIPLCLKLHQSQHPVSTPHSPASSSLLSPHSGPGHSTAVPQLRRRRVPEIPGVSLSPTLPPHSPSQKRGEATLINSPPPLASCCRRHPVPPQHHSLPTLIRCSEQAGRVFQKLEEGVIAWGEGCLGPGCPQGPWRGY